MRHAPKLVGAAPVVAEAATQPAETGLLVLRFTLPNLAPNENLERTASASNFFLNDFGLCNPTRTRT